MNKCDFIFRGETLSGHGYTLCEFELSGSPSAVSTDSQRELTSISLFGGKYHPVISSIYSSAFIAEMTICKIDESTNFTISPKEASLLKRWLCSPAPSEFRISGSDYDGIFWNGVFNVEEIHASGECVGFKLTFTATTPFAYRDAVVLEGAVVSNGVVTIDDISDEEGYVYPDIEVVLQQAGDLKITNSFDNRTTVVKGCSVGETITFSHLMQINSSNKSHILGDDFNYKFTRISNTYRNTLNTLTFSLPCKYIISYNPIVKVVI